MAPQRFYVTQQTPLVDRHRYSSLTRFNPLSLSHCFEATCEKAPGEIPAGRSVYLSTDLTQVSDRFGQNGYGFLAASLTSSFTSP